MNGHTVARGPLREIRHAEIADAERSIAIRESHGDRGPASHAREGEVGEAVAVEVAGDDRHAARGSPGAEAGPDTAVYDGERTIPAGQRNGDARPAGHTNQGDVG